MIMLGVPVVGSPLLPTGLAGGRQGAGLTAGRLTARIQQVKTPFTRYNVAAVVRGSDPTLSAHLRARIGAHYDHVGIVRADGRVTPSRTGRTTTAREHGAARIARVMQQAPVKPRRSVLFVWHIGERKGAARLELVHRSLRRCRSIRSWRRSTPT
jgi:hypothetical protein